MRPEITILLFLAANTAVVQGFPYHLIGLLGRLNSYKGLSGSWLSTFRPAQSKRAYASLVSTTAVPATWTLPDTPALDIHAAGNHSFCCSTRTTDSVARRVALSASRLSSTAPPPLLACGPRPKTSAALPVPCHEPLGGQPLVRQFQTRLRLSIEAVRSQLRQLGVITRSALFAATSPRALLDRLQPRLKVPRPLPPSAPWSSESYQPHPPVGSTGHVQRGSEAPGSNLLRVTSDLGDNPIDVCSLTGACTARNARESAAHGSRRSVEDASDEEESGSSIHRNVESVHELALTTSVVVVNSGVSLQPLAVAIKNACFSRGYPAGTSNGAAGSTLLPTAPGTCADGMCPMAPDTAARVGTHAMNASTNLWEAVGASYSDADLRTPAVEASALDVSVAADRQQSENGVATAELHEAAVTSAGMYLVQGSPLHVFTDASTMTVKADPGLAAAAVGQEIPHPVVAVTTKQALGGPASLQGLGLQISHEPEAATIMLVPAQQESKQCLPWDGVNAGLVTFDQSQQETCLVQEYKLVPGIRRAALNATTGVSAPRLLSTPPGASSFEQTAALEGEAALRRSSPGPPDLEPYLDAAAQVSTPDAKEREPAPATVGSVADPQLVCPSVATAVDDKWHLEARALASFAGPNAVRPQFVRDALGVGTIFVAVFAMVMQAFVVRVARRRASDLHAALEAADREHARDKYELCTRHDSLVSDLLGVNNGMRTALVQAEAEVKRQRARRNMAVQAAVIATRARAAAAVQIAQRVPELQRAQEELAQALQRAVQEGRERGTLLTAALGRCRTGAERLVRIAAAERAAMQQRLCQQAKETNDTVAALEGRHWLEMDELRRKLGQELAVEQLRHKATAAAAKTHREFCDAALRELRRRTARNLAAWRALRAWLGLQVEMLSERAEQMASEHSATLADARSVVEQHRLRVATIQQQLAEQVAVVVETNRTMDELTRLLEDKDSTIMELEGELTTTSAALESQRRQCDDLQQVLTTTEDSLSALQQEVMALKMQLRDALAAEQSAAARGDRLAAANALLEQQVSQFVKTASMLAEMEEAHLAPVRAHAAILERQMAAEREAAAVVAAEQDAKLAGVVAELAEARREAEAAQRARGELARRLEEIECELRSVQSELHRMEEDGMETCAVPFTPKLSPGWGTHHHHHNNNSRDQNRDQCDRDQEAVLQQLLAPLTGLPLPLPADTKALLAAASPGTSSAAAAAAVGGLPSGADRAAVGSSGIGNGGGPRASGSLRK